MSGTANEDESVLIVVPCLNEAAHIGPLLDHLLAEPGLEAAPIVVADGGSTDGARAVVAAVAARAPRVRLLDNPRRIQGAGVNAAVRAFGGGRRWLVRVDAHAAYPPGYVTRLLAVAAETGADAVVTPLTTQGRGCFQRAVAAAQNSPLGTGGSAHRHAGRSGWVEHGHHALVALEAFAAAGGYDESFPANEDAELDARLGRAGLRIWLAGDLPVTYYPRAAVAPLFRQYLRYGEGRARTARRHRMGLRLRQALPLLVAPACLLAPFGLFTWPLAAPALVWALACLAAGVAVGLQARDGCALLAGPAAMVMHLAWSAGFWRQRLLSTPPGPEPAPLEPAPSPISAPPQPGR